MHMHGIKAFDGPMLASGSKIVNKVKRQQSERIISEMPTAISIHKV